jgi:AcrR family transcriptional regulator
MRNAADTRNRILRIAADLFTRKGFTGTSISDIARELGTTTAALYYHFPSKADILAGLLAEPLKAYGKIIEDLGSSRPSAESVLAAHIDLAADARALGQIIDRDPAVLPLIEQLLPYTSEQMRESVIAALTGPDAPRSAILRAQGAVAVVKEATLMAVELGGGTLQPQDRAEILATALRALNPPDDAGAAPA